MAEYGESDARVGPDVDDIRELLGSLRGAWGQRNAEYSRMRRLYRGEHYDPEENPAGKGHYSLTANYLKPFADKDVQILMGTLPGIQMLPPSPDNAGRGFAEKLEGLLYGNWRLNKAHKVFLDVAWNAVVLRRGLIYYWWDFDTDHFRFKSCTPENFYPVYDGDEMVESIYVSRRLTRNLQKLYPQMADQIESDDGMDHVVERDSSWVQTEGGVMDALGAGGESDYFSQPARQLGYTTVIDYYNNAGEWVRVMGEAVHSQRLNYPTLNMPFIEVVNSVQGEGQEPQSSLEQLAELNMYYDVLLSQRADVIKKWANPPIIDKGSGVAPATTKAALSGDGGVLPINPNGDIKLLLWEGTMPEITEQMQEVKEAMYDLSGKPRSAFGQTITNQSGVMTNLALTPTLQSNELRETLWGDAMVELNRQILMGYEKFARSKDISFKGTKMGRTPKQRVSFEVTIKGKEINGWYENRMKWPSAIRTDDPAFVQMELSKMTSQPQAQSIYDTLENIGVEDVENHIDRIKAEREDARVHPEVATQALDNLIKLSGAVLPPDVQQAGGALMTPPSGPAGGGPSVASDGTDPGYNAAMQATGNPQPVA